MEEMKIVSKVSARSKKLQIEIKQDGTVILTRPKFVSEKKAIEFLESKREWVEKTYKKILEEKPEKLEYVNGEKIYYLGKPYILNIKEVDALNCIREIKNFKFKKTMKSIVIIDLDNNILEMYIKNKYNTAEIRKNEILNFLAKEAYLNIEERLDIYKEKMNLTYNIFRIKDTKTRWGSCSSNKNLNFNYKLILMPQWVIDYVVVHELAHLKHMDHSKNFWNFVKQYAPKYKDAKKWIKENQKNFEL